MSLDEVEIKFLKLTICYILSNSYCFFPRYSFWNLFSCFFVIPSNLIVSFRHVESTIVNVSMSQLLYGGRGGGACMLQRFQNIEVYLQYL